VIPAAGALPAARVLLDQNALSLKLASRGYVLENGRVTLSGAGVDLLSDDRVRSAYLGL
jgi:branched-chain amino acid transport system ATP-binding protein